MCWAAENRHVVFTHDLDFGILLAHTKANGPSVLQVRTQDVSPSYLGNIILHVLKTHAVALENGALITVDETKSRIRILKFPSKNNVSPSVVGPPDFSSRGAS